MSKKAIAIIGATGSAGSFFAQKLARGNHRLLLFDHDTAKLTALVAEIRKINPAVDAEFMNCAGDASWEADVIIPDVPPGSEKELAEKIKQFTNRKIILSISSPRQAEDLETLLPGVRIVKVMETGNNSFRVEGDHIEAIETTKEILQSIGFKIEFSETNTNKNIKHSKINTMDTTKWVLDPAHAEIHFKVRHLMVSWVTGSFKKFDASVETNGEDITTAKAHFTADINSISTNNEQRDAHLKTGDFFDAENHPLLAFESEKLERIDDENYKLYGTLTMRGVSKKVVLNVEHGGITQDPWGNTRTGFSITGKINRKDFGVSFGMVSETGGVLLGDDVSISANVEFVKQAAAAQVKAA
ncbi:MAG TPA: YceI family protein [Chitinophagaceae bacterium]